MAFFEVMSTRLSPFPCRLYRAVRIHGQLMMFHYLLGALNDYALLVVVNVAACDVIAILSIKYGTKDYSFSSVRPGQKASWCMTRCFSRKAQTCSRVLQLSPAVTRRRRAKPPEPITSRH